MIGYCAIARNGMARRPPRQIKSAMTVAKIGRLIKKPGMLDLSVESARSKLSVGGRGTRFEGNGLHKIARGELLKPFGDDALSGRQAVEHKPLVIHRLPKADRAQHRAIIRAQYINLAAAVLVAADRLQGNCQRVGVNPLLYLDPHIHARQKFVLWVGELAAQGDLASRFIDTRIGEEQPARLRIDAPVIKDEPHLGGVGRDLLNRAALKFAPQLLKLAHRLIE